MADQEFLIHELHFRDRPRHQTFESVFHGCGVFEPGIPMQRTHVDLRRLFGRSGRRAEIIGPLPQRFPVGHRPELVREKAQSRIAAASAEMDDQVGKYGRQLELKIGPARWIDRFRKLIRPGTVCGRTMQYGRKGTRRRRGVHSPCEDRRRGMRGHDLELRVICPTEPWQ